MVPEGWPQEIGPNHREGNLGKGRDLESYGKEMKMLSDKEKRAIFSLAVYAQTCSGDPQDIETDDIIEELEEQERTPEETQEKIDESRKYIASNLKLIDHVSENTWDFWADLTPVDP